MFCYNCGKEIDDKAAVCVGCGVPTQKQGSNNVSFIDKSSEFSNFSQSAESSAGMKGYDIAVLILSILAYSFAGLCLLFIVISVYIFWIPLGTGIAAYVVAKVNKSKYCKLGLTAMIFGIIVTAMLVFLLIVGLSALSSIGNYM